MKDGPERALFDDYHERARRLAGQLGYRNVEEIEIDAGGGPAREAERIAARLGPGALVCLDERGEALTSARLSERLAGWRDSGLDVDFVIGGADGVGASILDRARLTLAFGAATWPHRLVRSMLCEQIYRALSIEAGTPYHRA